MTWLLSEHRDPTTAALVWTADCLTPGCLWTCTHPDPRTAEAAAWDHALRCHHLDDGDDQDLDDAEDDR